MQKTEDRISASLYDLQLNLENSLRFLTKNYDELSKKFSVSHDKRDDKVKASDILERRSSTSDSKPFKKIKLSSEKSQKSARAKSKRTQPAKSQESSFLDKSSEAPKIPKSDASNRFWSFVDCYCTDIKTEDINMLEKWIESHEKDVEFQTVPELGQHYSSKWMEEEILEERKEGSKSMENPKGSDYTSVENNFVEDFLEKFHKKINEPSQRNNSPLVEKIISSLVQENIITSSDIMTEYIPDEDSQERKTKEALQLSESSLENRLRVQLAELGVLERNADPSSDDELLQELKRLQALLIPISELNLQKKKVFLARAKVEMARQEAQKRIQETDAKVMESYRTMAAARSKGKKLGKKELSQIRNMLEERDNLIKSTRFDI